MIGVPTPNRERFLAAIAERVSPDRVEAVFLFPPMRQGPVESGVAVLAVTAAVPAASSETATSETATSETATVEEASIPADAESSDSSLPSPGSTNARPTVLTARYRHTLKGPDRGKWELEILEQADAPLVTIEMVVRGVQERLDDTVEPERLGADELRAALADGVWATPQR